MSQDDEPTLEQTRNLNEGTDELIKLIRSVVQDRIDLHLTQLGLNKWVKDDEK